MDDGRTLHGQLYDRETGAIVPFTEKVANFAYGGSAAALGNAGTEIVPKDANASQVRVFDLAAIATALASVHIAFSSKTRLDLPDELTAITVGYNTSNGEGSDTQAGDVDGIGTSISGSLTIPASSTSSFSIIPEVNVVIKPWSDWAKATPTMEYFFYLPGDVSYSALKSKVATLSGQTIHDWPKFRPQPHTVIASGKQVSLKANSMIHQSVSMGPSGATLLWNTGEGYSYEVGNSSHFIEIPPTIHGTITISGPSTTTTIDATTAVSWPAETNWPARSAGTTVTSGSITASVTPTGFTAQTVTTVPITGFYLYDYQVRPDKDGHSRISATVVDMSYFA